MHVSAVAIGLSKIIAIFKASAPYIEDAGNLVYKHALIEMLPPGPLQTYARSPSFQSVVLDPNTVPKAATGSTNVCLVTVLNKVARRMESSREVNEFLGGITIAAAADLQRRAKQAPAVSLHGPWAGKRVEKLQS